jgi:esterase/lipase
MRISKVVRIYFESAPYLLVVSLTIPFLNSVVLWLGGVLTLQAAAKYSINTFFAISSPFEIKYPYWILSLLSLISGYTFFPTLLTLVIGKLIQEGEEETKLWVAAYRDAERAFPKKKTNELKKIADELVEEIKRKKLRQSD